MLDDGQTVRRPGTATVTGNTMGRIIRRKRTVVYYLLNRKHPSLTEKKSHFINRHLDNYVVL